MSYKFYFLDFTDDCLIMLNPRFYKVGIEWNWVLIVNVWLSKVIIVMF